MKKLPFYLFLVFLFVAETTVAQNIGSKTCAIQKVNLPVNYTNPETRFYSLQTKGRYAYGLDEENKRLFGWEIDEVNPTVKAVVSLYGFVVSSPKKRSKKVEKKDDDGKVTSSYTEYWYEGRAEGRGTLYLYGHQDEFVYVSEKAAERAAKKGPTKAELKRQEKEAEAKEKINSNQFLSAEDKDELASSDVDEDLGLENSELPLAKTLRINQTKSIDTKKHRSAVLAYKEYKDNIYPRLMDFKAAYPQQAYNNAVRTLNHQYGFAPSKNVFRLRTIKSKKHAEFSTWGEAIAATGLIMKKARFNKPANKQAESMKPIMDYFVAQVNANSEDDKKQRKLKKAALTNIMNIYYYLDQHDDVIAMADKFVTSKKLDKFTERFSEKSKRQKAHLAHLDMKSGHLNDETIEFDESEIIEVEEEVAGGN